LFDGSLHKNLRECFAIAGLMGIDYDLEHSCRRLKSLKDLLWCFYCNKGEEGCSQDKAEKLIRLSSMMQLRILQDQCFLVYKSPSFHHPFNRRLNLRRFRILPPHILLHSLPLLIQNSHLHYWNTADNLDIEDD